jgi:uncharacterized protein (DUF4415 family)
MKRSNTSKNYGTDSERFDAMKDEDIDLSDIPEATEEMFARGVLVPPINVREPREQMTLKIDRDVAKWFRDQGEGYHELINFLLRRYMQEELRKPAPPKARRA